MALLDRRDRLGLASYPVGVSGGFVSREEAVARALTTLRFFRDSPHGPEPDATGNKGFYYHFLDMKTGRRTWKSELSTVDTTFLLAGALTAAQYFTAAVEPEAEIRRLAEELYLRADWVWAQNGGATVDPRMETGAGIPALSLGWVQRGAAAVSPGARLTHASTVSGVVRGLALDVRLEAHLRLGIHLCRAAVHPPDVPPLGGLPGHSGSLRA